MSFCNSFLGGGDRSGVTNIKLHVIVGFILADPRFNLLKARKFLTLNVRHRIKLTRPVLLFTFVTGSARAVDINPVAGNELASIFRITGTIAYTAISPAAGRIACMLFLRLPDQ